MADRRSVLFLSFTVAVLVLALARSSSARPFIGSRVKRISDQRLAELETLVGLSMLNGKLVTAKLGGGAVDPQKIGRKRRSETRLRNALFNSSEEEDESGGDSVEPSELDYADLLYNHR